MLIYFSKKRSRLHSARVHAHVFIYPIACLVEGFLILIYSGYIFASIITFMPAGNTEHVVTRTVTSTVVFLDRNEVRCVLTSRTQAVLY